jgi:hypothetical protein
MMLVANGFVLVGCLIMVAVGFMKDKKMMLAGQCVQFALQGVGNLLFGSVSGCVACGVSIVRILVFGRYQKVPAWLKIGFIALQAGLTWYFGAVTLVQWLPVLAMVAYTWYLDTENATLFKVVNVIGVAMWLVHDAYYRNYFSVFFDAMTVISTAVGICLLLRERKKGRA